MSFFFCIFFIFYFLFFFWGQINPNTEKHNLRVFQALYLINNEHLQSSTRIESSKQICQEKLKQEALFFFFDEVNQAF